MKPLATTLVLGATLLMADAAASAAAARANRPAPTLEVEALTNLLDGTEDPGCRAQVTSAAGRKGRAWVSFGTVAADPKDGWQATSARSDCGGGPQGHVRAPGRRAAGIAYLILDLEAELASSGSGPSARSVTLRARKLSGFDSTGRPTYTPSAERTVAVGESDALLPLLLPDQREQQAFGVHDVWLRLRARDAKPAAAYGSISVEADVPGAEILLDGGFVGRVSEGGPTLLSNVPVGEREIAVRDVSGREARRVLAVTEDHPVVAIKLQVLDFPSAAPGLDLLPIGRNPQGQEEYWRAKDKAIVVKVPAGEFLMGSIEGQGEPHERPQHRVYVSEFLIDKLEVTWRQLRGYAEATGTPLPPAPAWGAEEDYAASNILWPEAQAYCDWVGGRLPTEAEWEKAARGTDGRLYAWGDRWDADRCYSGVGGPHRPWSVGSYTSCLSPYGVLEMPGGVWEWCADWYGEGYYTEGATNDPSGPPAGSMRVLRGGSWLSQGLWLRPAYRFRNDPSSRNVHHGFRCAQKAPG
jgi:formylglycine-generating enzyme required for sulfatase activity